MCPLKSLGNLTRLPEPANPVLQLFVDGLTVLLGVVLVVYTIIHFGRVRK